MNQRPALPMNLVIAALQPSDWDAVRAIYLEGMATGDATFETDLPSWDAWDRSHFESCRLVATLGAEVAAWAALTAVSGRCVYAGVAEVSVYVASAHHGQGIGAALLQALVEASERAGIWTLQAGIFPENRPSLVIHKRAGFREVGRRERIGQRDGRWRDTLLLERRSRVVGV